VGYSVGLKDDERKSRGWSLMAYEIYFIIVIAILVIFSLVLGVTVMQYKNCNLDILMNCIKKKKKVYLMEGPSEYYIRWPEHEINGFGFTEFKEVVKETAGTVKPCRNLGGLRLAHVDEYMAVTIPISIPRCIDYLSNELHWNSDEIAKFIQSIGTDEKKNKINIAGYREQLERENSEKEDGAKLKASDIALAMQEAIEFNNKIDEREKIKNYLKTAFASGKTDTVMMYRTISFSNVKDFVNTGINSLTNKTMLWLLIQEEKLDNMWKKDYKWLIYLGVGALLILMGLGLASQMGLFNSLGSMLNGGAQAVTPAAQQVVTNASAIVPTK
jgi:hypothetical protein